MGFRFCPFDLTGNTWHSYSLLNAAPSIPASRFPPSLPLVGFGIFDDDDKSLDNGFGLLDDDGKSADNGETEAFEQHLISSLCGLGYGTWET